MLLKRQPPGHWRNNGHEVPVRQLLKKEMKEHPALLLHLGPNTAGFGGFPYSAFDVPT